MRICLQSAKTRTAHDKSNGVSAEHTGCYVQVERCYKCIGAT